MPCDILMIHSRSLRPKCLEPLSVAFASRIPQASQSACKSIRTRSNSNKLQYCPTPLSACATNPSIRLPSPAPGHHCHRQHQHPPTSIHPPIHPSSHASIHPRGPPACAIVACFTASQEPEHTCRSLLHLGNIPVCGTVGASRSRDARSPTADRTNSSVAPLALLYKA